MKNNYREKHRREEQKRLSRRAEAEKTAYKNAKLSAVLLALLFFCGLVYFVMLGDIITIIFSSCLCCIPIIIFMKFYVHDSNGKIRQGKDCLGKSLKLGRVMNYSLSLRYNNFEGYVVVLILLACGFLLLTFFLIFSVCSIVMCILGICEKPFLLHLWHICVFSGIEFAFIVGLIKVCPKIQNIYYHDVVFKKTIVEVDIHPVIIGGMANFYISQPGPLEVKEIKVFLRLDEISILSIGKGQAHTFHESQKKVEYLIFKKKYHLNQNANIFESNFYVNFPQKKYIPSMHHTFSFSGTDTHLWTFRVYLYFFDGRTLIRDFDICLADS